MILTVKKSKSASLILGAGISHPRIPAGYTIIDQFAKAHTDLLQKYGLEILESSSNANSRTFVDHFSALFKSTPEIQNAFLEWLSVGTTDLQINMSGVPSDIHASFVIAWLNGLFKHLVTTNWDFLLEFQLEKLYEPDHLPDGSFPHPYDDPVSYTFSNGKQCWIHPASLYSLNAVDQDDFLWEARWTIMTSESDLENLYHWTKPIWKIHGSPFFLACPQCGGFSRWKHVNKLKIGDPCPDHPEQHLVPEINIWDKRLDKPSRPVWKRLKERLKRSDLVVVCGLSGTGSDSYIREAVEDHSNAWVVDPKIGVWNSQKITYIPYGAKELSDALIGILPSGNA